MHHGCDYRDVQRLGGRVRRGGGGRWALIQLSKKPSTQRDSKSLTRTTTPERTPLGTVPRKRLQNTPERDPGILGERRSVGIPLHQALRHVKITYEQQSVQPPIKGREIGDVQCFFTSPAAFSPNTSRTGPLPAPSTSCIAAVTRSLLSTSLTNLEQQPARPAQRLRREELRLRARVCGVDEARGVDLHLREVAHGGTGGGGKGEGEAETVAGGVVAVGGGEGEELGAVLREEAGGGGVSCIATAEGGY